MKRNRWGVVCVNSCCLALLGTASVGAQVPKRPRAARQSHILIGLSDPAMLRMLAALPEAPPSAGLRASNVPIGSTAPQDVGERVRRIVSEVLGVPVEKVTRDSHFVNDLGADSLDAVELVLAVEKEFGITIPDSEASKLQTVGQLIEYIQAHAQV